MTREEQQLLITDLCGRLPHGVIFQFGGKEYHLLENINYSKDDGFVLLNGLPFSDCKPYLRPMESMTKDELKEFVSFTSQSMRRFICEATNTDHWFNNYEEEDWLNEHHFDYRGLIEKGLALKAKEGMYE